MPKTVTIPGYDKPIDFPDSMSQDQINAASKKLYEAKHPPASTDPSGRTPTGEPAPGDTRNALQRTLDNLITPDPRREEWQSPGRNMADTFARGVAENVVPLVSHPLKSVGGMLRKAGQAIADNPGNATGAASDFFIKPLVEQWVSDYQSGGLAKAVPHMAGTGVGLWATGELGGEGLRKTGKVLKGASGSVGEALRSKYGPRNIPIGEETVPVTVGEGEPTSAAGRKATQLKRSGVGAKKFDKFEAAQQAKVKSAMRKLAQQTSGATGPMPEEPGAAMKYGADTVFETARPMYAALDEELVTVPGDLHSASAIVKQAIARAKKLGYDFEASMESHYGEEPLGLGKPVSDSSSPLTNFQKIRSELGKMRRGSRDPAVRYQISEEMKQMTAAMDKALDNTGLKDTWKEADRLWAKGYAMREISDALKSATKGAESAAQPKGIEVVPSEIKGASLEETLKDLWDDGTLERGLTHDEISNLRQSANILKRADRTATGSGYGESGSRSRAIAHVLRGAPGPLVGAGVGGGIGLLTGHGFLTGAEAGGFAGFLVQSIGERALVSVMTKLDGVGALEAVADAKTPAEMKSAMTKLAAVAAVSASKKRPGDLLRQTQ